MDVIWCLIMCSYVAMIYTLLIYHKQDGLTVKLGSYHQNNKKKLAGKYHRRNETLY